MLLANDYYTRALKDVPGNTTALLGAARTHYALERYAETDSTLQQLRSIDPSLAEEFAYLGSGTGDTARASQAVRQELNTWEEE
jgi:Tfp pilus assembly protein PilF